MIKTDTEVGTITIVVATVEVADITTGEGAKATKMTGVTVEATEMAGTMREVEGGTVVEEGTPGEGGEATRMRH